MSLIKKPRGWSMSKEFLRHLLNLTQQLFHMSIKHLLLRKLNSWLGQNQSLTKNLFQTSLSQDRQEEFNISYLESKVFFEKSGEIYIGGEKITPQMRDILRDQAKQLQSSNLYEIINATVKDESFKLFSQAGTLEHLQYAKALLYWNKVLLKLVNALVK